MRGIKTAAFMMTAVLGCTALLAQEKQDTAAAKPEAFYKLAFRVIETGGDSTATSSRNYSQIVSDGGNSNEIRTGDKLPIATGSTTTGMSTQFQYIDVGTEIDSRRVQEVDGKVHAHVTAKLSSVGKPNARTVQNQPVIRQCQWDAMITVPIGKPTIIFSSDNPSDKGKTELELTATPIR